MKDHAQASRREFIERESGACDTHREKLIRAAERHGKPFKCAATFLPREILTGGHVVSGPTFKEIKPCET